MTEPERRQEILKAEEAIRQLANELGRAKEAEQRADATRQSLLQATTAVSESKQLLDRAASHLSSTKKVCDDAMTKSSGRAVEAVRMAQDQIGKAGYKFEEAAQRLEAATKKLHDCPQILADALNTERARLANECDATAKRLEAAVNCINELQQRILIGLNSESAKLAAEIGKLAEAQRIHFEMMAKRLEAGVNSVKETQQRLLDCLSSESAKLVAETAKLTEAQRIWLAGQTTLLRVVLILTATALLIGMLRIIL